MSDTVFSPHDPARANRTGQTAELWAEEFVVDPDRLLGDLLAGYARVAPYERATTLEKADLLFGGFPPGHPHRAKLDEALERWLIGRSGEIGIPPTGPSGRWLGEMTDALLLVGKLHLPRCAKMLRTKFIAWNSWAETIYFSDRPDVRAAFTYALAQTQRTVASMAGIDPFGLEPFWLEMCREAGGKYPRSYLTTAILGLRMLPERRDVPSERPWVTGLASWALVQRPSQQDFQREWGALRRLYFATPAQWHAAVRQTLNRPVFDDLDPVIRNWWEKEVGLVRPVGPRHHVEEPSMDEIRDLIPRLHEAIAILKPRLRSVIERREQYARNTGDSSPLVGSVTWIGTELLKRNSHEQERAPRGEIAIQMASAALFWQPNDGRSWALLRDGLVATGNIVDAEKIGWEIIRRFPEDARYRSQLATFLAADAARWADAEKLLRETMARFPQDEYPHNQLADLLAKWRRLGPDRRDRSREAEQLLRETARRLGSVVATNQLAYLIGHRSEGRDEAVRLLDQIVRAAPTSTERRIIRSRTILARLISVDPRKDLEAEELLLETIALAKGTDVSPRNQLAYIWIRAGEHDRARKLLKETLALPGLPIVQRRIAEDYWRAIASQEVSEVRPAISLDQPSFEESADEHAAEEAETDEVPVSGVEPKAERTKDPKGDSTATPSPGAAPQSAKEAAANSSDSQERQPIEAVRTTPSLSSKPQSPEEASGEPEPHDATTSSGPHRGKRAASAAPQLVHRMLAVAAQLGQLRKLCTNHNTEAAGGPGSAASHDTRESSSVSELASVYARYISKWVLRTDADTPASDNFALSFIEALRNGDTARLDQLAESHRGHSHLLDVARIILQSDRSAADRTFNWLARTARAEPRALIVLRGFLVLRLGAEASSPDRLFNAIAANDNLPVDLEEAVLAAVDTVLAA